MRNAWIVAVVIGLLGACQDGEQKKEPAAAGEASKAGEAKAAEPARQPTEREAAARQEAATTQRGVAEQRELEQLDALMIEQQRLVDEATAAIETASSDSEREAAKQRLGDLERRLVLLREKQAQVKARTAP